MAPSLQSHEEVPDEVLEADALLQHIVHYRMFGIASIPWSFKDQDLENSFRLSQAPRLTGYVRNSACAGLTVAVFIGVCANIDVLAGGGELTRCNHFQMSMQTFSALLAFSGLMKPGLSELAIVLYFSMFSALCYLGNRHRSAFITGIDLEACTSAESYQLIMYSDSLSLMMGSILLIATYAGLPLRCKACFPLPGIHAATYLALTLPMPAPQLEGGLIRRLIIAAALASIGLIGFLGRAGFELSSRFEFLRIYKMKKDLTNEKVLRCAAEHEIDGGPFSSQARRQNPGARMSQPEASDSSELASHSTGNLSSVVFAAFKQDNTVVQAQLQVMSMLARKEHWFIPCEFLKCCPQTLLGKGGFGAVFRGEYHGVPVALKVPSFSCLTGSSSLANEFRVLRHLRHPCIVTFYGAYIDEDNMNLILVEELIDGRDLESMFTECQEQHALFHVQQILVSICQALQYLHCQEPVVVHGDLSPKNVLINKWNFQPKLIDFGLSRVLTDSAKALGGTIRYAAPEVLRKGTKPDPSADVFSFGRIAYFVVTGRRPLEGSDQKYVMELAKECRVPELVWPEPPAALQAECMSLCQVCLFGDRSLRLNAKELCDILLWWPGGALTGLQPLCQALTSFTMTEAEEISSFKEARTLHKRTFL